MTPPAMPGFNIAEVMKEAVKDAVREVVREELKPLLDLVPILEALAQHPFVAAIAKG